MQVPSSFKWCLPIRKLLSYLNGWGPSAMRTQQRRQSQDQSLCSLNWTSWLPGVLWTGQVIMEADVFLTMPPKRFLMGEDPPNCIRVWGGGWLLTRLSMRKERKRLHFKCFSPFQDPTRRAAPPSPGARHADYRRNRAAQYQTRM
jgi:hypothetical protein